MIGKININKKNGNNIAQCELVRDSNNNLLLTHKSNILKIFTEVEKTENGYIDVVDIDIDHFTTPKEREYKARYMKSILTVRFEMGYYSGQWAENEYLFVETAQNEIDYITGYIKNHYPSCKFEYNPSDYEPYAEDYDDCILTVDEYEAIINNDKPVTDDNYLIVDAIASDMCDTLINYLTKKVIE